MQGQAFWKKKKKKKVRKRNEQREKEDYSEEANKWGENKGATEREEELWGLIMTELIDQEFSLHSFSLSSSARGKLMWQSLFLFLCSSVGVRHHERCRLLLHLCFPVNHGSKVKGHSGCSGTFGNARANPYLQIPVVSSQEDPHCLTLIWRQLIWSMLTWLCTCSVLWTSKGMILPLTLGHLHRDKWMCSFCLWSSWCTWSQRSPHCAWSPSNGLHLYPYVLHITSPP